MPHIGRLYERDFVLIVIVTEFPSGSFFQWHDVWNIEKQNKNNVSIVNVEVSPEKIKQLPPDHKYWNTLKEADGVFVYVSRFCLKESWEWFKLPVEVKKFMKPNAKMICQFDDELIWMVHQENEWWGEEYDYKFDGNFEKFFVESNILNVADAYFTVLEEPWWKKHCSKPIFYMPLPQLSRYPKEYPYPRLTNGNIAVIRHMSRTGSSDSLIKNVTNPLRKRTSYFYCSTNMNSQDRLDKIKELDLSSGSFLFGFLFRDHYLDYLSHCLIGIDDSEHYVGWSRFVMECAFLNIPCISSNYAGKLFFPELYVKHGDYETIKDHTERLFRDKKFCNDIAILGKERVMEHLNPDRLCESFTKRFIEIGTEQRSKEEQEFFLFVDFLRKLRTHEIPRCPTGTEMIDDRNFYETIDLKTWNEKYGRWYKFISDRNTYIRVKKILYDEGII